MKKLLLPVLLTITGFAQAQNPECCEGFEASFDIDYASPFGVHFIITSSVEEDAAIWHFGDGETSNVPSAYHLYTEPGLYQVCLVIENNNGCRSELCRDIAVDLDENPCPNFVANFSHQVNLENLTASFTNLSPDAQAHIWHFGDGGTSNDSSPSHQYEEPGVYQVCLVVESGDCRSEYCREVCVEDVNPCAEFGATFTSVISQVSPLQINFQGDYSGNVNFIGWHFGDGDISNAEHPEHVYDEPGVYTVCLVVENEQGCRSEVCHTIAVGEQPVPCQNFEAAFTFSAANNPQGVIFDNNSTGEWNFIVWNFGDGETSNELNPDHLYDEPGLYEVCVVIENNQGCRSEFCHNVPVNIDTDPCNGFIADFTHEAPEGGLTVNFNDISSADAPWHIWHFGDGSASEDDSPSHTYDEPGIYNVCMVIESENCRSEHCVTIAVGEQPEPCQGFNAAFTYTAANNPLGVIFDNNSTGEWNFIVWNFGDGETSNNLNPDHLYDEPGLYEVCVVIENNQGCRSEYCINVSVNMEENPCPDFVAEFTHEAVENGLTHHFFNNGPESQFHIWHFGDGQSSDGVNPFHTYAEPGIYQVCHVLETGDCRSEICHTIAVGEQPVPCANFVAGFTFAPANNPMGVIFTNTSTGEWTDISWTFGDFATSDNANPDHLYGGSGLYEVCLWIGNGEGCGSDFCMNIPVNILEDPCNGFVADFAHEAADGLTVNFSDISEVESEFVIWHFGDGSVSDDSNPSHTYAEPGIYQVCMVLEDDVCRSEYCISIVVGELPDPCLGFEAGFDYEVNLSEGGIYFQNLSSDGVVSYSWNFGDGSESDNATPIHEFDATGLQNVCLQVENEAGCVAEFCMNVHVPAYYFYMVGPMAVENITEGQEDGIVLFPNPFTDVVQFATTEACQVDVLDMSGRLVFTKGAVLDGTIDLGTLSSGLYLLRTTALDGTVRTARAVKR